MKLSRQRLSSVIQKQFSPTHIGGLLLWLKADAIVGLSDGDPVTTWTDLSHNNKNAIAAGAVRPTFKTSIINGKPVVRFGGSYAMSTPSIDLSAISGVTIFIVFSSTTGSTQMVLESSDNYNNHSGTFAIYDLGAGINSKAHGNVGTTDYLPSQSINTDPLMLSNIIDFSLSANEVSCYVNGNLDGTRANNSNNTTNFGNYVFNIGARNATSLFLTGDIAEIIVYSAALSNINRKKIEKYLHYRWGHPAAMACLPAPRWGLPRENSYINGKIYATHGMKNPTFYTTCYEYDISQNIWVQKANASHGRDGPGCWVYSNKLYVFGGRNLTTSPVGLNYVEMFDPVANSWTDKTTIPVAVADPGVCGLNDGGVYKIFVVGGYTTSSGSGGTNMQLYYPATDTWETVSTPANIPYAHASPGVVLLNGYIYVFGGNLGLTGGTKVDRYQISTNTWTTLSDLPVALQGGYNMMAVVDTDNNIIHVFNGATHYIYNVVSDTYTVKATGKDAAWRNMTYDNGVIYASGGQPVAQGEGGGSVSCGKYFTNTDSWIEFSF